MVRDFDTIEEWQQLLWGNRTAGSEIVKCCYTIFYLLGSSVNAPGRCWDSLIAFQTVGTYRRGKESKPGPKEKV